MFAGKHDSPDATRSAPNPLEGSDLEGSGVSHQSRYQFWFGNRSGVVHVWVRVLSVS